MRLNVASAPAGSSDVSVARPKAPADSESTAACGISHPQVADILTWFPGDYNRSLSGSHSQCNPGRKDDLQGDLRELAQALTGLVRRYLAEPEPLIDSARDFNDQVRWADELHAGAKRVIEELPRAVAVSLGKKPLDGDAGIVSALVPPVEPGADSR